MTRVVICAASSVTRAGLTAIATTPLIHVVDQVGSVSELMTWLQTQTADLVLVELPTLSPALAQDLMQLVLDWPSEEAVAVLVLLEDAADDSDSNSITQLMSTGRISILPLAVSAEILQQAIATITTGLLVLHPEIAETLSTHDSSSLVPVEHTAASFLEPLTPREVEVLNQLAAGLSNKAIASALDISEHTVKFHISAVLSKLDVASRTEAVAVGIRAGLVML
ncbi:MAG: response regulator transcription factor [Cyanobacteria bacterium P01_H01_bin.58]